MSRSSLTLLSVLILAIATPLAIAIGSAAYRSHPLASADPAGRDLRPNAARPTVEQEPVCTVDATYPLRVVLSDDPAPNPVPGGAPVSIAYEIVASRQFESVEVELIPSPGVQLLGGTGALQQEEIGFIERGGTRSGQVTARLGPGLARGTVEVRLTGWTDGRPLHTAAVWNLLSDEQARLRTPRAGVTAQGRRVQEHPARRVSP